MKKLIAMACFMLAASPLAFAQDKAKDDAKKAAPAAAATPITPAAPAAPAAKADAPKADTAKGDKDKDKDKDKPKKERTAAQKANDERLKECNAQAGDKKGDERQKFMGSCIKSQKKAEDDKKKSQQSKMATCNKEAGDKKMKGDDRKAFMKDCLSADKAAPAAAAPKAEAPAKK